MINVGGMHRSGTTLAHFILGAHSSCIAFGEVRAHINNYKAEASCSCGKEAQHCPFWGEVWTVADFESRAHARYPFKIPVTSDKGINSAFSMIRDVRGWARSTGRQSVRGYLAWWKHYRKAERTLSYERLCAAPETAARLMCYYSGLPYEASMLNYGNTEHHAIKCNRMAGGSSMGQIQHDMKWAADSALLPALMWPVMRLNQQKVYGGAYE